MNIESIFDQSNGRETVNISMYRLCKNISRTREKRDMSAEELAKRMGESTECVMQIEKGRKYLTVQMLMSVCLALDVTPNELLEGVKI